MKPLLIFISILFFGSCQNSNENLNVEISNLKESIQALENKLENVNSKNTLVHEVYFDLKEDTSTEQLDSFKKDIEKLSEIEVVKNLRYGNFKNLNDPRAFASYEMIMILEFTNSEDYQVYKKHPVHLKLKESAGKILAAPPGTYDYVIE